jgi:hypothetical protein
MNGFLFVKGIKQSQACTGNVLRNLKMNKIQHVARIAWIEGVQDYLCVLK